MERETKSSAARLFWMTAILCATTAALYWAVAPSGSLTPSPTAPERATWQSVLANISSDGFKRPPPDWTLDLPADHGVHPDVQTENWQVFLNVQTADGTPMGLQLSLMRLGLVPPNAEDAQSAWDIRDIYRGHIIYVDGHEVQSEERFARGMQGVAGEDIRNAALRLDEWTITFGTNGTDPTIRLAFTVESETAVTLDLHAQKDVLPLAPSGANTPFVGYAYTRLRAVGTIRNAEGEQDVSGAAWFEHTWGDLPLPGAGPIAWDRVQFHLDDGTDVAVLRARRTDGRGAATINGLIVKADGQTQTFDENDVEVTPTRTWLDAETGASYPVAWHFTGLGNEIALDPIQDAQVHDFMMPVWSGFLSATGQWNSQDVSGGGHLQLTGYAQ